jgi:hypothetical protein
MVPENTSTRTESTKSRIMVWFFAGGETRDNKFNVFTGSFIRLMTEIMENEFDFVRGVYYSTNMMNVVWALNNSQRPFRDPAKNRIIDAAFSQLISNAYTPDAQLIIVSSSTGSVIAAQTANHLAELNRDKSYFSKPFHLALGASMVAKESDLFRQLLTHQKEGNIGTIVYDELQDEGDSSNGVGSTSRVKAWMNAVGLMFPYFSSKYQKPSFLNIHPAKGHLHRRRSQTAEKALDYIHVLLVKHKLGGNHYHDRALEVIKEHNKP